MKLFPPSSIAALVVLLVQCKPKEDGSPVGDETTREPTTERRATTDRLNPAVDLREARAKAQAMPDGEARDKAIEAVAWNALELDPEMARELIAEMPPGSAERIRLTGHLAMRLADESSADAVTWARSLDQSDERSEAFARIAVVMANDDPVKAAELLFTEVGEGGVRDRGIVQIVQRWVQQEPAAAVETVESFPAGRLRSSTVNHCLTAWIRSDPPAAARWLEGLQDEELQSDAVRTAARILSSQPAELREQFTKALSDEALEEQLK